MRADEVYAILKGKLVKLTEDIKTMGDWKPIQHKGTVQTADDLPTDAKEGWMYNIATDSIYGAAGMNVVMTSEGWDPMGSIINMGPYLTKEEGNKTFQPKGNYLSGTDSDLKESGKAADAKVTGEKIAKNSSDITKKLDKNQGVENSGKIAGINESGDIVPIFPVGVEYNSETNCLEFGSDQKMKLNQGIGLDSTLTKTGSAADAGATGKEINSLKEDISNKITKFYASNQGETHLADSDNGKIQDVMLYGRSEQKQYSGKNLLPTTMYENNIVRKGVTFTNNGDGSVTVSGTSTDITYFTLWGYNQLGDKGILPGLKVGDTVYVSDCLLQETNSNELLKITENSAATINSSTTTMFVGIKVPKNTTINKTFHPQIELGSEATAYEPYTGGIPSPNPDYPQEIKSVVNPTVKVSNEDGTKSQTVTLPYTLNAIPVSSGGNVTIDSQQYIADYVDVERGKRIKMVGVTDQDTFTTSEWSDTGAIVICSQIPNVSNGIAIVTISSKFTAEWTAGDEIHHFTQSIGQTLVIVLPKTITTVEQGEEIRAKGFKVYYILETPIEIDLPPEEIAAFKALTTYYPTTNISVNSEQLDGYTVLNYPISMENGWNYVKQQLNDNRNYIYDMDLQSAEAYVNSEYAVALTELEV